jgi:hypothetical protein
MPIITEKRDERPLFIPLRGIWFDAFDRGQKTEEWRRFGPRWNEDICRVGRPVLLSRGYSGRRLAARIASVSLRSADEHPGAVELFGAGTLCIVLGLHQITPLSAAYRDPPSV